MRITGNDKNEIFSKYVQINEDVGLGPGVPKQLRTTSVGNSDSAAQVARRPAAATAGSGNQQNGFPGTNAPGADESCEEEAIEMAKSQLLVAAHKAVEMYEQLCKSGQLEAWAASKITLASDYLETVADYLEYNQQSSEPENEVKMIEVEPGMDSGHDESLT